MSPRGSQGPDEGDRRSRGVERYDPGRIRLALSRSASGQGGMARKCLLWGHIFLKIKELARSDPENRKQKNTMTKIKKGMLWRDLNASKYLFRQAQQYS